MTEKDQFVWDQICAYYEALGNKKSSRDRLVIDEEGYHTCVITSSESDGTSYKHTIKIKKEVDPRNDYWIDYLSNVSGRRAVIDGNHYVVGKEPRDKSDRGFQGMAGREFHIRFFDPDEVVVTHNLWSQGRIPPLHRDRYPDNAEFVTGGLVTLSDGTRCWNSSTKLDFTKLCEELEEG